MLALAACGSAQEPQAPPPDEPPTCEPAPVPVVGVWREATWPQQAMETERVSAVDRQFGGPGGAVRAFPDWSDVEPISNAIRRIAMEAALSLSTEMAPTTMTIEGNLALVRTLDLSRIDVRSAHAAADSVLEAVRASDPVWPVEKVVVGDHVVLVAQGEEEPLLSTTVTVGPLTGTKTALLQAVGGALHERVRGRFVAMDLSMQTHDCSIRGGTATAREHVLEVLQACSSKPYVPYYALRTTGDDWWLSAGHGLRL